VGVLGTALRVVAVWLVVNLLLVVLWAGVAWFARRARGEVRRRRAEVAFTAIGTAAILAALSLVNPGVRQAVTPIVNSALGLTRTVDGHGNAPTRSPSTSPGSFGAGLAPSTFAPTGSGPAGRGSSGSHSTDPIVGRRISHDQPPGVSSPSPTPAACPDTGPAPTGSTGPSPTPAPSPCPDASPSPDPSPSP
jgi:hypothetical protein